MQKNYELNLDTALSYMQLNQREDAIESINLALSQVPDDEKTEKNKIFLRILSIAARLAFEVGDIPKGATLVNEGLKLKSLHADLSFLNVLYLKEEHRYGEILSNLINYLVAIDMPDVDSFNYDFVNHSALNEIYEKLIPLAYRNTPNHSEILSIIKDTVEKLDAISGGEYLKKAYDIMIAIDREMN